MIDTHVHLNFDCFDTSLDSVLDEARNAGVTRFVVPGTNVESSKRAIEIAEKYEDVYAAVGIHPGEISHNPNGYKTPAEHIQLIRECVSSSKKVVAIGEVGLDRFYLRNDKNSIDHSLLDLQKEYFKLQRDLAMECGLPLIVHNREATKDVIGELGSVVPGIPIIIHCAVPEKKLLQFAMMHKFYIGVDGDVTFDQSKADFIKNVPLELLLLETDAPFLTPEPIKSDPHIETYPNVPSNLIHIARKIAELRNMPIEEIMKITDRNAHKAFNIDLF